MAPPHFQSKPGSMIHQRKGAKVSSAGSPDTCRIVPTRIFPCWKGCRPEAHAPCIVVPIVAKQPCVVYNPSPKPTSARIEFHTPSVYPHPYCKPLVDPCHTKPLDFFSRTFCMDNTFYLKHAGPKKPLS